MNSEKIIRFNKTRALLSILFDSALAVIVFTGILIRLFHTPNEGLGVEGPAIFRMFTIESNLLVGLCAVLCLPYQIDGYRTRNFHMPRWIMYTFYVGVTAVAMTFFIVIAVLSPFAGYRVMLLTSSNMLLHLFTPVLAITAFLFVVTDHNIKRFGIPVALLPIALYGAVYMVMVFVIGEENGGWSDVYQMNTYAPWPVIFAGFLCIAGLITAGLRAVHNKMHARQKDMTAQLFLEAYGHAASIEDAVLALAEDDRRNDPGDNDITVPRRTLRTLEEQYHSELSMAELGKLYLSAYLDRPVPSSTSK